MASVLLILPRLHCDFRREPQRAQIPKSPQITQMTQIGTSRRHRAFIPVMAHALGRARGSAPHVEVESATAKL